MGLETQSLAGHVFNQAEEFADAFWIDYFSREESSE